MLTFYDGEERAEGYHRPPWSWRLECAFLHDDFGADVGEHRRACEESEEKE